MNETGIVEKGKKILEEHEKKQKLIEASIDDILAKTDKVFTVELPELGVTVHYKKLTIKDVLEIRKQAKDDVDKQALLMLTRMLQKVNPNVTLEKVQQLPSDVAAKLLQEATRSFSPFLSKL